VEDDPTLSSISSLVLATTLAVVTLNELIGPILTKLSIGWAGESGKDRPRVIDFIHEENIVMNFDVKTKEDGIKRLVNLLIRSNHLALDEAELTRKTLEREADTSTCVGNGLALPHVMSDKVQNLVGVMAINRKGLPFDTPDGKPVHCIVLLVTPPSKRDRYLEVLAAIARAITGHRNIRDQLYSAKTSAHVYELLHAEDAEDFNYFRDES